VLLGPMLAIVAEGFAVGFATLPEVIAAQPPARVVLRAPRAALASLLPRLDGWLRRASARAAASPPVHVLTGRRGAGKSTLVGEVVERLRRAGFRVGGVWAPGRVRDGVRWGFDAVDLATRGRATLARRDGPEGWQAVGPFRFDPEGIALARRALSLESAPELDLVVVDEVGPWELAGEGYATQLDALRAARVPLLVVVRDELLGAVVQRWAALQPTVWRLGESSAEDVAGGVAASLRRASPDFL
jgi:nucleoside-triphosphatase